MRASNYYNKEYFEKHDYLDYHIAEAIKILMKKHGLRKVLDAGCGTGRLVDYLNKKGFKAIGCDSSSKAIKIANKITKNHVIKASCNNLPFKGRSFDLILCLSVIEHLTIDEAKQFLLESHRVLQKNGYIFIITPNYASPFRFIQRKKWLGYSDPTHINFYTPWSLTKFLANHKFGNFQFLFQTDYSSSFELDLPSLVRKLPQPIKAFIIYIIKSTPIALINNNFWIAAQKK